jgi:hypothetical protein
MFYDSLVRPQPELEKRKRKKKQNKQAKNFMKQAPIIKFSNAMLNLGASHSTKPEKQM